MVNMFVRDDICRGFDEIEIPLDADTAENVVKKISILSHTNYYDMFVSIDALSRIGNPRELLTKVRNSLKEEGLVIALEHIGARRSERKDTQEEIVNMFYRFLPDRYRTCETIYGLSDEAYGAGSSIVIPSLGDFFNIDAIKYLGGSLFGPLFSHISTGFDVIEKENSPLMKVILEFEQVLIKNGTLSNDYAMVIARKRTGK